MTPQEKAKQQASVMLAYANGDEIEHRVKNSELWSQVTIVNWNWMDGDYRVKKPAPKVVKLEAWLTHSGQVCLYRADRSPNASSWKRIPSLDLEYTEDES